MRRFLTPVPERTRRKIITKAGRLVVTIGDSPSSSFSFLRCLVPLLKYRHTVQRLLTPTVTSSAPLHLRKETKTLLHTSVEVSNSDGFERSERVFILPAERLFSASAAGSPGLHLTSVPQWKGAKKMVGVEAAEFWRVNVSSLH